MADPYNRRPAPGRGPGRGSGPPKPFNGNQYPQRNQSQNDSVAVQSSSFPAPSYNQQAHGAYQQPSQGAYQQPAHSAYQQHSSQSAYQQPSHSAYQSSNHGNLNQATSSSFQQPSHYQQSFNYQQPGQSHFQPAQQGYQQAYGAAGGSYGTQPQYSSPGNFSPLQGSGFAAPNDIMADIAVGALKSQGENYFHRGQAYVQSKMGFLSAGDFQYLFDIDGSYVLDKIMLLLLPFFKGRSFARKSEQISGGHRYQPPRKDVFAPDLYIPFMSICSYVVLLGVIKYHTDKFSPDNMYLMGSSAFTGWAVQWLVIKTTLYLLSVSSGMPVLEILAYAGYPFFYACLGVIATILGGVWPYRIVLGYGTLAMATFLIRTLKHVLFQDSLRHGNGARYNYILFGLGAFQLPFLAWFHA